jgi:hypothetical protein
MTMSLTPEQRERVSWLLEGYLDEDYDESTHEERWTAEFAALTTPQELFLFASHSSASSSPAEWRQILDHPLCDEGTARLIYWRLSPVWCHEFAVRDEVPEFARAGYDLVREIEDRTGSFPHSAVRFDPSHFRGRSFLDGHSSGELARIPAEMMHATPGEPVEPLW